MVRDHLLFNYIEKWKVLILVQLDGEGSLVGKSIAYKNGVLILIQLDGEGSIRSGNLNSSGCVLILFQLDGEGSLWETMF